MLNESQQLSPAFSTHRIGLFRLMKLVLMTSLRWKFRWTLGLVFLCVNLATTLATFSIPFLNWILLASILGSNPANKRLFFSRPISRSAIWRAQWALASMVSLMLAVLVALQVWLAGSQVQFRDYEQMERLAERGVTANPRDFAGYEHWKKTSDNFELEPFMVSAPSLPLTFGCILAGLGALISGMSLLDGRIGWRGYFTERSKTFWSIYIVSSTAGLAVIAAIAFGLNIQGIDAGPWLVLLHPWAAIASIYSLLAVVVGFSYRNWTRGDASRTA